MTEKKQPVLPEAFFKRMENSLQDEFPDFLKSLHQPSPVSIRINPKKIAAEFPESENIPWSSNGKFLSERPVFTIDPLIHAGAYYVQEASSMFIEEIFKQNNLIGQPLKVLDLCAAPGGKSTHVLSLISKEGLLVTNEVIKARASILEENITKWGFANVIVSNNDPADFSSLEGFFDVIIVDAPCSGEGMFRKDPPAAEEWSPSNVALCSQRQERILHDIIPALKSGGFLIYSTCTFSTEENENNVEQLIGESFESVRLNIQPESGISETHSGNEGNEIYSYRFYPHKVKGEGFFVSCLRKATGKDFRAGKFRNKIPVFSSKQKQVFENWINRADEFIFFEKGDQVIMFPEAQAEALQVLTQYLRIKKTGVSMGKLIRDELIPSHDLALSIDISDKLSAVEVSREEALKYLKKEDFYLPNYKQEGWNLIRYNGINLGWVKIMKNRINNYYPVEWRIRMAIS
jgi:16S rRNA C967 or C1407 C5-methylase (RsmB/RsmF family)/NOL1/NOP2/fmu family ribosome biogenesis protein